MDLTHSAEKLEHQPLFLDHGELRNPVQFFFEVVADKLSDAEKGFFLDVEYSVVDEDVRVFVEVKD